MSAAGRPHRLLAVGLVPAGPGGAQQDLVAGLPALGSDPVLRRHDLVGLEADAHLRLQVEGSARFAGDALRRDLRGAQGQLCGVGAHPAAQRGLYTQVVGLQASFA